MALLKFKICKPSYTLNPNKFSTIFIDPEPSSIQWIVFRNSKLSVATFYTWAKPDLVVLYRGENLFISHSIYIPNDQELLSIFH